MVRKIRLLMLMLACSALILVFRMPQERISVPNLTIVRKSQSDEAVLPEYNHHNNLEWKKYHGKTQEERERLIAEKRAALEERMREVNEAKELILRDIEDEQQREWLELAFPLLSLDELNDRDNDQDNDRQDVNELEGDESNHPEVLIAIISSATKDGFELRQAVRETWLSIIPDNLNIKATFFVPKPEDPLAKKLLEGERRNFRDMKIMTDVKIDEPMGHLTLSVIKYAHFKLKVPYLLKVDGDIFVDLNGLFKDAKRKLWPNVIYGFMNEEPVSDEDHIIKPSLQIVRPDHHIYLIGSNIMQFFATSDPPLLKAKKSKDKMKDKEGMDIDLAKWVTGGVESKRIFPSYEHNPNIVNDCQIKKIVAKAGDKSNMRCLWNRLIHKEGACCSKLID